MKLIDRYRQWIAEPLLARMREEHNQVVVDRQREAYSLGRAHGELVGQQNLLADFTRILDERKSMTMEVTEADVERAKKGLVH